jgi:Flp pilus assembly protein TadD
MFDWLSRDPKRGDTEGKPAMDSPSYMAGLLALQEDFRVAKQLYARDQFEAAAERFESLVARKHNWADAHHWLGICRLGEGRAEDAHDAFVMALHFEPHSVRSRYGIALAEQALGRIDDALHTLDMLLVEHPDHADAYNMRGGLRLGRKDIAGARSDFELAIAADPSHVNAHSNLGDVLFCDLGQYEHGANHIERALELDPDNRAARCNFALVLAHRGDDTAAIAMCDRLLVEDPNLHEARLHRALVHLKLGRFDLAWDDYELRQQVRCSFVRRNLPWPQWQGEDLRSTTILVCGEQGLGDEIMYASCIGEVIVRARHTVIECSPRLHRLFERSFPAATVLAGAQSASMPAWLPDAPNIDVQVFSGSLPRHFRREWTDFPVHGGYLVPDVERVSYWSERLALLGAGVKVGLSWRGGHPSTRGSLRSLDLSSMASLLSMSGARFVDLQYGNTVEERAELAARGIDLASWPNAIADLDETAALIANLDVVITVCTTVVHLSGALGCEVWVLVPSVPEWRYLAQGERMPWYPGVRLFRQGECEDWDAVVSRVATALRDRIGRVSSRVLDS